MSTIASTNLRTVLGVLVALAVIAVPLFGAGFWDKKTFTQWNEKELRKIYTDSPWAKRVAVQLANPMTAFSTGGGGGGGRRAGAGGGGGGGGAPGGGGGGRGGARMPGGGGAGAPQGPPPLNLTVRFDEAAPIRAAKVKFNMGESTELTPQMQQYVDSAQEYYVVAVEGLPQMMARFEETPELLATSARLRRKGKQDIMPATVEVEPQNRTVRFKYFFTRDDPIVLADREVEFFMKLERPQMGGGQQGRRPGGQRGAQGQQRQGQGGQRGAQGQQRQGQGGQRQAQGQRQQGQGQRQGAAAGGRGGGMAMGIFGKEIKRKFRLKDMVYKGDLAL